MKANSIQLPMSKELLSNFELMSEYFYYIALLDMLAGIPFGQLENRVLHYEDKEMYEACHGIRAAIDEAEYYTLKQLELRIVEFEVENKNKIENEFSKLEMYL